MSYQENLLPAQGIKDGHDVLVLASTENMSPDGRLFYDEPRKYLNHDGVTVIRLPYSKYLPHVLMRKVRDYRGLALEIEQFRPDVMLFHGFCAVALRHVALYARKNKVPLFVDTHADEINSGRSFVSRYILHKAFYRTILRASMRDIRKVLCVSYSSMCFARKVYHVPDDMLEFYPLGGSIMSDAEYKKIRMTFRKKLGLRSNDIAIIQSGKFDEKKRLIESLRSFAKVQKPHLRLFLTGRLSPQIQDQVMSMIAADNRVKFLGWQNTGQLTNLLCAADIYLQPGTQSATMQHALCCHCAIILDNIPGHIPYFCENGWLINGDKDFSHVFEDAAINPSKLALMQHRSLEFAEQNLDYRKLSNRILHDS